MTACDLKHSMTWDQDYATRQLAAFKVHISSILRSLQPDRTLYDTNTSFEELYPHLAGDGPLNQMADTRGNFIAVRLSVRDSETCDSLGWCSNSCFKMSPTDPDGVDKRSYVPSYTIHRFDSIIRYRNWFEKERCFGCQRFLARGVYYPTSTDIFPFCKKHNRQEDEKPCLFPMFWNLDYINNISHK